MGRTGQGHRQPKVSWAYWMPKVATGVVVTGCVVWVMGCSLSGVEGLPDHTIGIIIKAFQQVIYILIFVFFTGSVELLFRALFFA